MKYLKLFPIIFVTLGFILTGCKKNHTTQSFKEELILKMTGDINADSLKSFDTWLQNMETRFALAPNNRKVANNIRNRFISMGYTNTELDSFSISKVYNGTTYIRMEYNVIATLRGSSSSDSVCIIGAHYDDINTIGDPITTAPGANDNGSGTSATLEVARVMHKNNFIPLTTIRFITFAAEEQGLLGSYHYAAKIANSGDRVRFMLNNDMIAYEPETNSASWQVNILDYSNSVYFRKEAETVCSKYSLLQPYNNNTYNRSSDSYPFFLKGYKALFFFADAMDPNYHKPADLVQNLNFDYCKEIVKVNCAILVSKN